VTLACGWCLAFNDECCGRPTCPGASWCAPGRHEGGDVPHTFFARFPGVCDACGGPIEKGNEVAYAGEKVLVHATCPEEAPEQKAPVCSTCNLTKPCDCEEDDEMTDVREDPLLRVSQRAWKQLDEEVDAIMAAATAAEAEPESMAKAQALVQRQARARGKAEILAVVMNIGWPLAWKGATADDISTEAGRRAAMRRAGREYGTIGVESSTVHLQVSKPGWTLAPDKRGVARTDGGA
jgi:hypothetical protein